MNGNPAVLLLDTGADNSLISGKPPASPPSSAELFEKAGVITKTTGQKALAELLAAQPIERMGRRNTGAVSLLAEQRFSVTRRTESQNVNEKPGYDAQRNPNGTVK